MSKQNLPTSTENRFKVFFWSWKSLISHSFISLSCVTSISISPRITSETTIDSKYFSKIDSSIFVRARGGETITAEQWRPNQMSTVPAAIMPANQVKWIVQRTRRIRRGKVDFLLARLLPELGPNWFRVGCSSACDAIFFDDGCRTKFGDYCRLNESLSPYVGPIYFRICVHVYIFLTALAEIANSKSQTDFCL